MRKYYTRPCNFYYGNYAKKLIKKKKALPLAGNLNMAFDKLEIFYRKKKEVTESNTYSIVDIKNLDKEILSTAVSAPKRLVNPSIVIICPIVQLNSQSRHRISLLLLTRTNRPLEISTTCVDLNLCEDQRT